MSLLSMCRTLGTLQRKTAAKDASGGMTNTFANVSGKTNVPCDIQPAGARIEDKYMQKHLSVTHSIYLHQDVGAKEGDLWIVGSQKFHVRGYRKEALNYTQWACVIDAEEEVN